MVATDHPVPLLDFLSGDQIFKILLRADSEFARCIARLGLAVGVGSSPAC
jgi:hypothetical protein